MKRYQKSLLVKATYILALGLLCFFVGMYCTGCASVQDAEPEPSPFLYGFSESTNVYEALATTTNQWAGELTNAGSLMIGTNFNTHILIEFDPYPEYTNVTFYAEQCEKQGYTLFVESKGVTNRYVFKAGKIVEVGNE